MNLIIPLLMAALPAASVAQSQSGAASGVPSIPIPKTTAVLVILTPKQGVAPTTSHGCYPGRDSGNCEALWYSRGDGKGVIFLLDMKTEDEARAVMETLPLAKEQLMDHEYVSVGPLMPLRALNPGALQ